MRTEPVALTTFPMGFDEDSSTAGRAESPCACAGPGKRLASAKTKPIASTLIVCVHMISLREDLARLAINWFFENERQMPTVLPNPAVLAFTCIKLWTIPTRILVLF